ncbi:MAG: DNA-binding protein [Clostridioides difficile]|nr:DNA-binding protein [Clostridioides sp.]MBS5787327.1 DNA-binding protein [Clostridioides difficile]
MDGNERIDNFLKLQEKNLKFADISKELGISQSTLRTFLNKRGYKSIKGKYILKNDLNDKVEDKQNSKKSKKTEHNVEQLDFTNASSVSSSKKNTKNNIKNEVKNNNKSNKSTIDQIENKGTASNDSVKKSTKKSTSGSSNKKDTLQQVTKNQTLKKVNKKEDIVKKDTQKRTNKKINITQDDLDKLCEVYDWYLQVKDYANDNLKKNKKTVEKDVFVENEKIEEVKSTTIRVDMDTWSEFERLCSNSKYSKSVILTQALKNFMKENKDLL